MSDTSSNGSKAKAEENYRQAMEENNHILDFIEVPDKSTAATPSNASFSLTDLIEPNVLSNYENITYNFRLYMTTEQATIETIARENIIVVAETGSTGLNITDVDIDTIISPSPATNNSFATNINIKIIEPFGASMFDYIRNSALELGILDHKSAPMWLDVTFKGYTTGEDMSYDGGEAITLSEETRTWRILIKNVEVEMNLGGTEYSLECIAQDESSLFDAARMTETKIHVDANTLGEFFDILSERLNEFTNFDTLLQEDKVENIRQYVITTPDIHVTNTTDLVTQKISNMRNWKIRGEDKITTTYTKWDKEVEVTKWRSTFDAGTPIEEIIQQAISSTEEGQSLLLFGEVGRKISDTKPRDPVKPSVAFVVDPDVTLLSYNSIVKTYNVKITYNIRHYITYAPIISRDHIKLAQSKEKSTKRLQSMFNNLGIKKRYDYMFTGENIEVLDYNIKLNRVWFVSLPIFKGQNRSIQASPGKTGGDGDHKKQPNQDKKKSLVETIKDLKKSIETKEDLLLSDDLKSNTINSLNSSLAEDYAQYELAVSAYRQAANVQLESSSNLKTSLYGAAEQNKINVNHYLNIENERHRGVENANNIGSIFFAEDFDKTLNGDSLNVQEFYNEQIHNVGAQPSPTLSKGEGNIEGTKDEDRSFFSAAMNHVYGNTGQLIKLNLTIKGDPYWLGEPNISKRLSTNTGFVDLTKSDSIILLSFMFPVSINDGDDYERDESYQGTGMYELKRKENGFNGVYRIYSVHSSFSGGRFTQELTGALDPITKEQDVIKELDRA